MPQAEGQLLDALGGGWPAYLGYFVSFTFIGGTWIAHSSMTRFVTCADAAFMRLNLVLLLFVSFLPFTTSLLASHLNDAEGDVAVVIFGANLTLVALLSNSLVAYAARTPGLAADDVAEDKLQAFARERLGRASSPGGRDRRRRRPPTCRRDGVLGHLRPASGRSALAGAAAQGPVHPDGGGAMTASVGLPDLAETAGDPLLDKVSIPKLQNPVMPLPSVYSMLSEGTTGPLTVGRGPAAAGKTVLVAAWIANDLPSGLVAWLSLDEHDNEPVAFWALTVEALRRHGVALPAAVRCPSEPGSHILTFLEELAAALQSRSDPVPQLRLLVTTRRAPSGVLEGPRLTVDL